MSTGPSAHTRAAPIGPGDRRRVALIVETSLASGREILQGVARYTRKAGGWDVALEPRPIEDLVPGWLEDWDGHGIIARVRDGRVADAVRAAGVPVVDVLGSITATDLPLVRADDDRISAMAAAHLGERGFRHFAFVGMPGECWSARRRDAFEAAVSPHAATLHVYDGATDLAAWVAGLPKPVGVMLCSDQIGLAMVDACRRARADIPGDVAVIGVDDDEPICEVTGPGLSSVWPDHSQVGYEAARLLDRLMRGGRRPAAPILVPPHGVVTRGSTDVAASDDAAVSAAVRLIHDRACDPNGLSIDDVAAAVSLSRSILQRRFRRATGRTLHDEMLRVRLARARTLLANTDVPIAAVAATAGFRHQEYMGAVFRQKLGVTPARYRRAVRV